MNRHRSHTIRPSNIASREVRAVVKIGAAAYDRRTMLPRLLPLGPQEVNAVGAPATRRFCALLARALRAERNRGRSGHWTYDLNRHLGLVQALKAERRRLAEETSLMNG